MGEGDSDAGTGLGLELDPSADDAMDCGGDDSGVFEDERENDPGVTSVIGMTVNTSVERGTSMSGRGAVRLRPRPTPDP